MDSETQAPLKANDPRMVAWKQYIASEEYANAKRWVVLPEHTEGSMWAAFLAGWESRLAAPHAAPREGEPWKCADCQREASANWDYCTNCGADRPPRSLPSNPTLVQRLMHWAERQADGEYSDAPDLVRDLREAAAVIASQQAALDAAGEAERLRTEWRGCCSYCGGKALVSRAATQAAPDALRVEAVCDCESALYVWTVFTPTPPAAPTEPTDA